MLEYLSKRGPAVTTTVEQWSDVGMRIDIYDAGTLSRSDQPLKMTPGRLMPSPDDYGQPRVQREPLDGPREIALPLFQRSTGIDEPGVFESRDRAEKGRFRTRVGCHSPESLQYRLRSLGGPDPTPVSPNTFVNGKTEQCPDTT